MDYVIEILQRELVFETQCCADAMEYLDGGVPTPMSGSEQATRDAFIESKRLAQERIPQLAKAIEIINPESHD